MDPLSDNWTGPYVPFNTPWSAVQGRLFKINYFSPISQIINGQVVSEHPTMPFGVLEVTARTGEEIRIAVSHSKDFISLWQIFQIRNVSDLEEVFITHRPCFRFFRFLNNMMPLFCIYIFPKDHFGTESGVDQGSPKALANTAIASWIHGKPNTK